jgi:hypothetical protein
VCLVVEGKELPSWAVALVSRKTCECGERIILVQTEKGKRCPFHKKFISEHEWKWEPHWATCPYADRFRQPRMHHK